MILIKIICSCCDNECLFDTKDEETGLENEFAEEGSGEYGQYARKVGSFEFWSGHDIVGFICNKCGKAIWVFV